MGIRELLELEDNQIHVERLVEVTKGRLGVIPFVGAGFSIPCGFPGWRQLLEDEARRIDALPRVRAFIANGEFEAAASLLLEESGAGAFSARLDALFGPRSRAPRLRGAVRLLPLLRSGPLITTNFDSVIEAAFEQAGQRIHSVVRGAQPRNFATALERGSRVLLKVHGDALEPSRRVLTREEYDVHYGRSTGESRPGQLGLLLSTVFERYPLLFLGCSLGPDRTVQLLRRPRPGPEELWAPRFAIVELPQDERDRRDRRAELAKADIRPIWYPFDAHDSVKVLLNHIAAPPRRSTRQPRSAGLRSRYARLLLASCERLSGAGLLSDLVPSVRTGMTIRELYIPSQFDVRSSSPTPDDRNSSRSRYQQPASLAECLTGSRSLVFVGSAGTGKTTLVQWLASVGCVRLLGEAETGGVPGSDDFPVDVGLPIVIRCRDLRPESLNASVEELLAEGLIRLGLRASEVKGLRSHVMQCLQQGRALLAFDGIDELPELTARRRLCRQIAQLRSAFPRIFLVVSCRAGSNATALAELPSEFVTYSVAKLTSRDRANFIARVCCWRDGEAGEALAKKLLVELDRSRALAPITDVPLLFTVALFIRLQEGSWPARSEIFERARRVLTEWTGTKEHPTPHRGLDRQLTKFAYALSVRNKRCVTDDELPDLAVDEETLEVAERHCFVVRTGPSFALGARRGYEFLHALFQAYFSALAFVFADVAQPEDLATHLTAHVPDGLRQRWEEDDAQTLWRDISLFFAESCSLVQAGACLRRILDNSSAVGDAAARERSIFAGLLVAYHPDLPAALAREALTLLASHVELDDGRGSIASHLDEVAWELAGSAFSLPWHEALLDEASQRASMERTPLLGLAASALRGSIPSDDSKLQEWWDAGVAGLFDRRERIRLSATCFVAYWAPQLSHTYMVAPDVLPLLDHAGILGISAARALKIVNQTWHPSPKEFLALQQVFEREAEPEVLMSLAEIFGNEKAVQAAPALLRRLAHPLPQVQAACVSALDKIACGGTESIDGALQETLTLRVLTRGLERSPHIDFSAVRLLGAWGDATALGPLLALLDQRVRVARGSTTPDPAIQTLAQALGRLGDPRAVELLLELLSCSRENENACAAMDALGWIRDARAFGPLIDMAQSAPRSWLRISAAEALGDFGDEQAIATLQALTMEADERLAKTAQESIEYLRRRAPTAPPRYRHYGRVIVKASLSRLLRNA